MRRSPLGPYGRKVVAGLCAWEIVALAPKSPVPTISETVDKFPPFGLVLLALLTHHWYIEGGLVALGEALGEVLEEIREA